MKEANICKRCHREVRFLTEEGICTACLMEIEINRKGKKYSAYSSEVQSPKNVITYE